MEKQQPNPEMDEAMAKMQQTLEVLEVTPEVVEALSQSPHLIRLVRAQVALTRSLSPEDTARLDGARGHLNELSRCLLDEAHPGSMHNEIKTSLTHAELCALGGLNDGILRITVMSKYELNTHPNFTMSGELKTADDPEQRIEFHSDGSDVYLLT